MDKVCLECGTRITGRVDKKFCDDNCRSLYNNKLNAYSSTIIKKVNSTLRKNRGILAKHNPDGKGRTTKKLLFSEGFNFDYFTSTYTTKEGKTYYYCYEQGYLPIENEIYLLVVKKE